MHRSIVFVAVYYLVSTSSLCGFQYSKEVDIKFPYKIEESKKLTLNLDKETVHPWILGSYFQYIPETNSIAYLNKSSSNIKLFDRRSGKTIKTVPLSRMGPNNVGNEPSSFYWLNGDSIFVFSDLNAGRLSLINSEGVKLKNYELQSEKDKHFVELAEVTGGIVYAKGFLFLGVRCFDFERMPLNSSVLSLEVATGKLAYIKHPLPLANDLLTRIPMDERYSSTHLVYNGRRDKLIVNFPLSDHLKVRNANEKWSSIEAKSVYLKESILLKKPLDTYKDRKPEVYMNELRFMPRYTGVFYDSYKDVYYRIGRLLYNKELHLRRKAGAKLKIYDEFSIQVFDKYLKKIGEDKFFAKGVLYEQGMFIDEDGLWLLCPQEDDEDVMEFKLMELTKIN